MAKYEIMLVVRGDIEETTANTISEELVSILKIASPEVKKLGLKELAYEIKKIKRGYYYQINFDNTDANIIKEFDRVARIKKEVLRHLIINLEKDYGYKAINNAKKVARNEKRATIHAKIQEEIKRKAEERQTNLTQEHSTFNK